MEIPGETALLPSIAPMNVETPQNDTSDGGVILMVDDSEEDAFFVRRALTQRGRDQLFRHVPSGLEAIAYLKGEGQYADRELFPIPGVILLDIKMPCVDGFDLLRLLRDQPGLCSAPIVVFSSSESQNDIRLAYSLGARAFIVKPSGLGGFDQILEIAQRFMHPSV